MEFRLQESKCPTKNRIHNTRTPTVASRVCQKDQGNKVGKDASGDLRHAPAVVRLRQQKIRKANNHAGFETLWDVVKRLAPEGIEYRPASGMDKRFSTSHI